MVITMAVAQVPTDEKLDLDLDRFCAATGLSRDQVMRLALAKSKRLSNEVRVEALLAANLLLSASRHERALRHPRGIDASTADAPGASSRVAGAFS
jgi:hypothetical protein